MITLKIKNRETDKTIDIKEFKTEREEDAFWFWWSLNGDVEGCYIERIERR